MTTLIAFTPNPLGSPPFQTNFTLDGATYAGTVAWNVYSQRWYLTLTDASGNTTWVGPIVGSPLTADIYLALGVFTSSTLLYREDTGNFEVNP